MPLPPDVLKRLYEVLLRCGPFDDYGKLKALFQDERIYLWREGLPRVDTPGGQCASLVNYLAECSRTTGENGLSLFLQVLRDRTSPEDSCHTQLEELIGQLAGAASPAAPPAAEAAPPAPLEDNPFYTNGRINDPALFFGRQRLLREVQASLRKRSSISLVGGSQIGKSSLLYYLYATRADWLPAVPVAYVDLQGVWDEPDFCQTVLAELGEAGSTPNELKRALSGREVVLLFDEMERLAQPDFNPRWLDLLRSLAQEPQLALCLATQRPLVEVFPPRTAVGLSPFHNVFTGHQLGPFSEDEARRFLAWRLRGTGVAFSPSETAQLLAKSAGHPARLQRLAWHLFAAKQAGKPVLESR